MPSEHRVQVCFPLMYVKPVTLIGVYFGCFLLNHGRTHSVGPCSRRVSTLQGIHACFCCCCCCCFVCVHGGGGGLLSCVMCSCIRHCMVVQFAQVLLFHSNVLILKFFLCSLYSSHRSSTEHPALFIFLHPHIHLATNRVHRTKWSHHWLLSGYSRPVWDTGARTRHWNDLLCQRQSV